MWWSDYGPMPWTFFGPLMFVFFMVMCMAMMFVMMRGGMFMMHHHRGGHALEILKERFARGEIDRAEYEDRRRSLEA
jgi:putative membrane protein